MSKRTEPCIRRILLLCILVSVLLCSGCSSSRVGGYTSHYNTSENLTLFQESTLFSLAQELVQNRNRHSVSGQPTTPATPFLAVSVRKDKEGKQVWGVCGGSAEKMDLSGVQTLVVCIISERTAQYRGSFGTTTGTTEDAGLYYLDVATGSLLKRTSIQGKDLPQYAKSTPHYTLSDSSLVSRIRKELAPPYTLTQDGEITGGTLGSDLNGYRFPDNVKKITKLGFDSGVSSLWLPASVEEIAPGVIPRQAGNSRNSGSQKAFVLTVLPGTWGETFARENGYIYQRPDDSGKYIWAAGCECTLLKVNASRFPAAADGPLAEATQNGYVLMTEEGSAAAEYAMAHQHLYSYHGQDEVRFCINGREWIWMKIDKSKCIVRVPEGGASEPDLIAWAKKRADGVLVSPGSAEEAACRAEGMDCWVGDMDMAECTWTAKSGLEWQAVYSFRDKQLLAVHIPSGYEQTGKALYMKNLCKDMGFSWEQEMHPLMYVQPDSWAAEKIPVRIEEGSDVLWMRRSSADTNAGYITEYACSVITGVVDAYFRDWDNRTPQKLLTEYQIKAFYTSSPSGYCAVKPYCLTGQPEKMYYPDPDGSIRSRRMLEGIRILRVRGDITDEEELSWVLERAGQEEPFLLQVEEGTVLEGFALENGIPCEIWDPGVSPFEEELLPA